MSEDIKLKIQDLRKEESRISGEIRKLQLEYAKSQRKFLPEDVRDELSDQLSEFCLEANGCDCHVDDHALYSDDELVEEYNDMVDGNEEDELLQKALGYQAEWDMLSRKGG
jgi:hypothetical protein